MKVLPGCRVFYALPPALRSLLNSQVKFEPAIGTARCGGRTFDDFRFLRAWWEVSPQRLGKGRKWVRFSKGGEFSRYYGDVHLVVNWENDGEEICNKNKR